MDGLWTGDMLEATRLTRAGNLTDATALLQRLLGGNPVNRDDGAVDRGGSYGASPGNAGIIDILPDSVVVADPGSGNAGRPMPDPATPWSGGGGRRFKLELPPDLIGRGSLRMDGRTGLAKRRSLPTERLPEGARFIAASFCNDAGSRSYKLYVPSGYRGQALPLLVMLHGCSQSPDDFAAGTRMNALAEEETCLVLYPAQSTSANAWKCWKWFNPGDQRRDEGEPSLIAGIARRVMTEYAVDPSRVYVAGLSAGAAAAAILGSAYPDLFAAIGVHSGLACGAAKDILSALAAMRQGGTTGAITPRLLLPTIVFHGGSDTTVHPRNADAVIAQGATADLQATVEHGQVAGGHAYSRTLYGDERGNIVLEQWVVHGAGHAWSGGSVAGSYTDPRGPDAAREMLRFFLAHPRSTS
jgi:poly(hydroxyalkanoate) depolymerase family esterase